MSRILSDTRHTLNRYTSLSQTGKKLPGWDASARYVISSVAVRSVRHYFDRFSDVIMKTQNRTRLGCFYNPSSVGTLISNSRQLSLRRQGHVDARGLRIFSVYTQ